ncbi:hypothetical protein DESUT3_28370 [Desulfuromonas versatilis]|uniref:Type IV pilus assembly protein PilM n=1 Tax=Desulfuromonas versatilis TaxID=2802975 RepID=A0ABN6E089_9BACT|nr:hypothetical protein [Desulfuromonas versatilis]BCR05768.1 hypothetical protein DESUT3_28370 [Desulfuromonas versatilis]
MIRRTYLGLDIRPESLYAVALLRQGTGASLSGGRMIGLDRGILELSVREPNIADRARFIQAVREVLDPLAGKEDRIALALPDQIGRVLLTEVETAFKSRDEGVEVVKWQLKNSLPTEARNVQLDYQVLERTENGRYRLMVSLMVKSVLQQYEEALAEAGYNAALIDFHSVNLYNYYRSRLESGEDFILVGVEGNSFSLQYYHGRLPVFHRTKRIALEPGKVFQEVNLSCAGFRDSQPGFVRAPVYLHTDWPEREPLLEALRSAFERDVVLLDPRLDRMAKTPLNLAAGRDMEIVAAVGVTERLL